MAKKYEFLMFVTIVTLLFAGCSKDDEPTVKKLAPQYFNGKLLQEVDADSLTNVCYFDYCDDGRLSRVYKASYYESFCLDYVRMQIELGGTMLYVPFTQTKEGFFKTITGNWDSELFYADINIDINYDSDGHFVDATFNDEGLLTKTGYAYKGTVKQTWENGNLMKSVMDYSAVWKSGDTVMSVNTEFVMEYTYTNTDNKWQQNTKLSTMTSDIIGYSGFGFTGYLGKGSAKLPKSCTMKTKAEVEYNGQTFTLAPDDVVSRAEYVLNEDGTIKEEKIFSYPYIDLENLSAEGGQDMQWNTLNDKLTYTYEEK